MATPSSLATFYNVENQKTRTSHRKLILRLFEETNDKYTTREVSVVTGLSYNAAQKRISELLTDSLIKIEGSKEENNQFNSIYYINRTPKMFSERRKSKFDLLKQSLEKKLPEAYVKGVMREFNRLKKKQDA